MTFAQKVLAFHRSLQANWRIPTGFELLYPFEAADTLSAMTAFYEKFFSDHHPRKLLLGINPGRFGAGVTGIAFTDPIRLADDCGIPNPFHKRSELSSIFIYEVVEAMGGPESFYQKCYISSVCPLGFTRNGINCNYYDDRQLQESVEPYIIENLSVQHAFGCTGDVAICLGQGKNYKYLKKLNDRIELFREVVPLPHPRWVMQYRRRTMDQYVDQYVSCLQAIP
ncbi:MAG: uracil-DNA glycosylase family protein [Bacteroidota bacterium]